MAATVVGAMIEAYEALPITPLPALWFDELPEGAAESLPNVGLEHLGEDPTYEATGRGKLRLIYTVTKLRLHVLNAGFEATNDLAESIRAGLPYDVLVVDGASDVTLTRGPFRLSSARYRDVNLKAAFAGVAEYEVKVTYPRS